MTKLAVTLWAGLDESETCIANASWPAVAGVPAITPVFVSRVSPLGREPEIVFQTNGKFPPVVMIVPRYGAPACPSGNAVSAICSGGNAVPERETTKGELTALLNIDRFPL